MALFGNKKTDEEIIEETLAEFNIFEGVLCQVTFPEKPTYIACLGPYVTL